MSTDTTLLQLQEACLAPAAAQGALLGRILKLHESVELLAHARATAPDPPTPSPLAAAPTGALAPLQPTPLPQAVLAQLPLTSWPDYQPACH